MSYAPLAADEERRLAALSAVSILDTGPDERFDRLTAIAADICDVPTALISLVSRHRQWFKSRVGFAACETPRDVAFCAHAILEPGKILIVEDATLDPRFAHNPLVLGDPGIRFYAGAPLRTTSGDALGTLCVVDVVKRRLSEIQRRRLSGLADIASAMIDLHRRTVAMHRATTHDALTGLVNGAMFEVRLATVVENAKAGSPCALLLADLDNFRSVNEKFGHGVGDALLEMAALRLSSIIGSAGLVARIGGDKFAVLLDGALDLPSTVEQVAKRIETRIADFYRVGGQTLHLSASIGSAISPIDAIDERGLLAAANLRLREAKRIGKLPASAAIAQRRRPPAPSISETDGRRMEVDLQAAMSNGELALYWQPFYDAASGDVAGYEALLRWTHPERGQVSPSIFLPVAESSHLMSDLDGWVLRTACRSAAKWVHALPVAVNLSAHWFSAGLVADHVQDALAESGLAPSRLEIELTERTLISNRDTARSQMEALRAQGVGVAIDDFGTGHSSLAYLRRFPFSKLKLDRAFVAPLGQDPGADDVARAIVGLGQALRMKVCAEGIETRAQLAFLRREGCDLLQGYLLGTPSSEPAAERAVFAEDELHGNVIRLKEWRIKNGL